VSNPLGAAAFYRGLKQVAQTRTYSGWETHNRGDRGDGWGPVNGVLIHHTVTKSTASAIAACRKGVTQAGGSFLPGPLYNLLVDKQGVVHLIGWGRANHAGNGDDDVLRAIIREQLPFPRPNEANTDGNARLYGIGLLNMGDGKDPYPVAQLDAAADASAVLCSLHAWSEGSVAGHKEWQPGKIDPVFGMDGFRARVKGRRRRVDQILRAS
jgi:hypothetical protein